MFEWITKYRFRRKGLLITWDWGYAKKAITPGDARSNGLVLFRNRWVTPTDKQRLIRELRIFQLVRVLAVLVLVQALFILVDALVWSRFSTATDLAVSVPLMGLAFGLWCFKPIAWGPAIGYALLITGAGVHWFFSRAAIVPEPLALAPQWWLLVVFLAYVFFIWFVLLNKTARKIFS